MISETLGTLFDLVIVVLGFSLIIVIHELGHFLAARWAGIRVLAFAGGFGPALVSYRKGLGWRRGSSEEEYAKTTGVGHDAEPGAISPTEYRLNALPLGGYVRMLGQEDLNPGAVSSANDSYQSVPVYKRMVVISAGVIFNIVTAAAMFVMVFMVGLKVEPAVIGTVAVGSPAERAGLVTGDVVLEVNGRPAQRFEDVAMATAMARPGSSIAFVVERAGEEPFAVEIEPRQSDRSGLLEIGVGPSLTTQLIAPSSRRGLADTRATLRQYGLADVEPGMTLIEVTIAGGETIEPASDADLIAIYREAGPRAVTVTFEADDGERVTVETRGEPEFETGLVKLSDGWIEFEHLAGLTPVMRVAPRTDPSQGLEAGDVFARVGGTDFPSVQRGIFEIRASRGESLGMTLLRGTGKAQRPVELTPDVSRQGTIGFAFGHTGRDDTLLAATPRIHRSVVGDEGPTPTAADDLSARPGSRIVAVNGALVSTLGDVRTAMQEAIARAGGDSAVELELTIAPPGVSREETGAHYQETMTLDADAAARIAALGWEPPFPMFLFAMREGVLKASNPVGAVGMGLWETRRVLVATYLTFARLFQGTIKVTHLRGPVGIAHLGTLIADRGPVWLVFFFALISVNLAVINFLPLPIVDGGQFLMLVYEQFRGKPVPIVVQNGLTLAGLFMIGTIFLVVTFNDVRTLFGL